MHDPRRRGVHAFIHPGGLCVDRGGVFVVIASLDVSILGRLGQPWGCAGLVWAGLLQGLCVRVSGLFVGVVRAGGLVVGVPVPGGGGWVFLFLSVSGSPGAAHLGEPLAHALGAALDEISPGPALGALVGCEECVLQSGVLRWRISLLDTWCRLGR